MVFMGRSQGPEEGGSGELMADELHLNLWEVISSDSVRERNDWDQPAWLYQK